jgi:hypothetical protein
VFIAAFLLALAAPVRLRPVERCSGDAEFSQTRRQLERAVARRDVDGLISLMSDDVRFTFGAAGGREGFRALWAAAPQDRAALWKELGQAMQLGCAKAIDSQGREYRAMPAMFVTGGELDGFSSWVARPGATLRSKPNGRASVNMHLPAWTVLDDVEHDGGAWIEAHTPKGRRGYILIEQARSLIDYRIVFGRRDGRWRITAFVAGD